MNDNQRNKLSMFLAVLGVMETNHAVWQPLSAVAGIVTRLTDLTAAIQQNSGVQGTPRTGVAQGKSRKQVEMVKRTAEVAGDLHSYAVAQGDDTLAGQSDVEVSDLLKTADSLVGPRCRELLALAQTHAAALAGYGTEAADLTALDAAIGTYEGTATAPRQATVTNTVVAAEIARDVAAGMLLLKAELDKAMRKFERKSPAFFQTYQDARSIIDLGHGLAPELAAPVPPKTSPV